ncbi:MAG: AAA family ATPase, partial [Anaerolineales bacterium]|nr:AAA family ATPase [Anaerolineales bacterium]
MAARFARLAQWLALEAAAEQAALAAAEQRGENHLSRLVLQDEQVGLGERLVWRLRLRQPQAELPWTPLSAGSPVIVTEEGTAPVRSWRGVVSRLQRTAIEIAFAHAPEPEGERPCFAVDLAPDAVARQRMEQALARVAAARGCRLADLRDVLIGRLPARFSAAAVDADLLAGLNAVQQAAVRQAMAAEDVALIHGPPGTGKTTTLVAVIRAAVRRGERVLACAPSNMAVDNLCLGLLAAGEPIVRLGHPARLAPQLQAHALDALVAQHDDVRLAQQMRREALDLQRQAGKWRRAQPERGAKQTQRREARELFDTARQLEAQAVARILDGAPILLATLTGLDGAQLGERTFDLGVIDEAGQATEPATWIPVPRVRRVVLAGDPQQLPPTVLAREAAGLGVSLLEGLMAGETAVSTRLEVQYRMHADIMGFSSAEFYDGSLRAAESVAGHLLADLPGVARRAETETAVVFIDTAGASYEEEVEPDGSSRLNRQEAALVVRQVRLLRAAGVQDIGIITPYAAQVRLLRAQLPDDVEIHSVDGFQGREKEAIVISLVRSN